MIHCVCRQINTATVDHAASCGARTAACVMKHCRTRFNCGQCRGSIEERLQTLAADGVPAHLMVAE